jgi:hypothetical protein
MLCSLPGAGCDYEVVFCDYGNVAVREINLDEVRPPLGFSLPS